MLNSFLMLHFFDDLGFHLHKFEFFPANFERNDQEDHFLEIKRRNDQKSVNFIDLEKVPRYKEAESTSKNPWYGLKFNILLLAYVALNHSILTSNKLESTVAAYPPEHAYLPQRFFL